MVMKAKGQGRRLRASRGSLCRGRCVCADWLLGAAECQRFDPRWRLVECPYLAVPGGRLGHSSNLLDDEEWE
jgi:hypothetical protein